MPANVLSENELNDVIVDGNVIDVMAVPLKHLSLNPPWNSYDGSFFESLNVMLVKLVQFLNASFGIMYV